MFQRTLYEELLSWKKNTNERKPLIVHGARQVGKTFLIKHFGKNEFRKHHYINFEKDATPASFFKDNLDPKRIIGEIEFYLDNAIDAAHDLIIFDEIQSCPRALTALKYFCEEIPELAVIAAGSLLGLSLGDASFPVGKVSTKKLHPLCFTEFLHAVGEHKSINALKNATFDSPPSEQVHAHLLKQWQEYLVVGGMPEVVHAFATKRSHSLFLATQAAREKQNELTVAYLADIAKYCGKQNALHLERVWEAVAAQLGSNLDASLGRFRFRGIVPGVSHADRLMNAVDWLCKTGLVIKVPLIETGHLPLISAQKKHIFKLYLFDVGLLGALTGLEPQTVLAYNYGSKKGFFVENFVAQALHLYYQRLFSWKSKHWEIDFLIERSGSPLPIEVKAGISKQSSSLKAFTQTYAPKKRIILNVAPLALTKDTARIPLYLLDALPRLLAALS